MMTKFQVTSALLGDNENPWNMSQKITTQVLKKLWCGEVHMVTAQSLSRGYAPYLWTKTYAIVLNKELN